MRNFEFHNSATVNVLFEQAGLVIKNARELAEAGKLDKGYAFDIIAAAVNLREAVNCAGYVALHADRISTKEV